MKFKARIRDLAKGLEPAVSVATKGTIKEYENALFLTIIVDSNGLTAIADGGKLSIYADIGNTEFDKLDYEFISEGIATVKAVDIKATLSSFDENALVTIELTGDEDSGRELLCILDSDPDQFQTLPVHNDDIMRDRFIDDFMETVKDEDGLIIRRDIFVSASSRLAFAHGFEEYRPAYLYWVIRAKKGEIRFAAGSGGRFAILDFIGNDLSNVKEDMNLVVPNEQTVVLNDILGKISDENFVIHKTDRHMITKTNNYIAVASNYDPDIEWPSENTFLERENAYKITTRVGDWPNAVKGLAATNNEDVRKNSDYHVANLQVDLKKNVITAKTTGGSMRSQRKIRIEDAESASEYNDLTLNFLSKYLFEAFKNSVDDEHVQIEIESSDRPVVIRYHAGAQVGNGEDFLKPNEAFGVQERYSVFFATFAEDE